MPWITASVEPGFIMFSLFRPTFATGWMNLGIVKAEMGKQEVN